MQLSNKRIYGRTKEINIEELRSKFHSDKLAYIKLAVLFGSRASDSYHLLKQMKMNFKEYLNETKRIENFTF